MSGEVVLQRSSRWLPRVIRDGAALRLEFAGGADALHEPRTFAVPIHDRHREVLQRDLARHLILHSALAPLARAAGIDGPLDETAAVALLDPILLGSPAQVDALLATVPWERGPLVAHGADLDLLAAGDVVESLRAATDTADWQRAQKHDADRRRAERGVTLSPLDIAILTFTGQLIHGSTIPRRNPGAVDPAQLGEVQRVVAVAERGAEGLAIARDPRRGSTGTDKQDWQRMEAAVGAAVRAAHLDLADDAVRTLGFLICSEAATRARSQPFDRDAEAGAPTRGGTLTFTDDAGVNATWAPGDQPAAAEAFWQFVAQRVSGSNEVFTLEDEQAGDGIQLHLYSSTIARVKTLGPVQGAAEPGHLVEYALVDDLAHYRALVRGCVAGGFDGLNGLARWLPDADALEQARRAARRP